MTPPDDLCLAVASLTPESFRITRCNHHMRAPTNAVATSITAPRARNAKKPSTIEMPITNAPTMTTRALAIGLPGDRGFFTNVYRNSGSSQALTFQKCEYKIPRTMVPKFRHHHSIVQKTDARGHHRATSIVLENPRWWSSPHSEFCRRAASLRP